MNVKNSQELKQLQTRKAKMEVDLSVLKSEAKEKQQQFDLLNNKLKELKNKIYNMQNSEIIVTEHAIIRYLERAMGLDLEQIKGKILTEQTLSAIETMGSGKYPIGEGLKAVVKGRAVVSVT